MGTAFFGHGSFYSRYFATFCFVFVYSETAAFGLGAEKVVMYKTNEDPECSNLTMLDQTSHHIITTMHLTPASRAQSYTNNNSALDNMHTERNEKYASSWLIFPLL